MTPQAQAARVTTKSSARKGRALRPALVGEPQLTGSTNCLGAVRATSAETMGFRYVGVPWCSIVFAAMHCVTAARGGTVGATADHATDSEPNSTEQPSESSSDVPQQQITGQAERVITAGGYSFDVETLRGLITKWQNLAASYETSFDNARVMTRVEGPGLDYASQSHAEAANRSGRAYYDYLVQCRDYCLQQARSMQDALNEYLGVDQSAAEDINTSDGGIL